MPKTKNWQKFTFSSNYKKLFKLVALRFMYFAWDKMREAMILPSNFISTFNISTFRLNFPQQCTNSRNNDLHIVTYNILIIEMYYQCDTILKN